MISRSLYMDDVEPAGARLSTLGGARAGRGFRYQDAVATALAVVGLVETRPWVVSPEASDDVSILDPSTALQLQVRSHRGRAKPVGVGEFATWLVDLWSRHGAGAAAAGGQRFGIVVDHPVTGVEDTGLGRALGDGAAPELRAAVKERFANAASDADLLLARTHLLLASDPAEFAAGLLATHLDSAAAVAEVVFRQILARIGELSDARALASASASGLSSTELSRLIDETLAVVDLEAVEAVVRDGVCEYVDFATSVEDDDFYLGVDAVPGHVAAGLVIDRPDDVETVVRTLEGRRRVIITGPSGVGKTSLAWLAAFTTRHSARWIRVRHAGPEHVTALLRYANALRPAPQAPVAFVLDDIGRLGAPLWDALASEVVHRPGVLLLGTAREEDLDLIEAADAQTLLRPRLTESVAQAIWQALADRDQTVVPSWREAFEDSNGLTLEYVHLLTTGERLAQTIQGQIAQRRREGRDVELRILRIAGLGATFGGAIDLELLRSELRLAGEDLQRALIRLFDEHLVHQVDGNAIGGIHRLRSEAIARATHTVPPPTEGVTARAVIATVRLDDLPGVAAAAVDRGLFDVDELENCLSDRLRALPASAVLTRCLEALRMVGFLQRARRFETILEDEDVAPMRRPVTVSLAAIEAEPMDALAVDVQAALRRLVAIEGTDPRPGWLARVPEELLHAAIDQVADVEGLLQLLQAFHALSAPVPTEVLSGLGRIGIGLELPRLAELIAAARDVSTDLAEVFLEAAGGVDVLLGRARRELTWVTSVELDLSDGHEVRAEWLFTGAVDQADPHAQVVELCRVLAGLFPRAATIAATAVDPSGKPAGFGEFTLVEKNMPRRNLPTDGQVRWNRAFLRAYADIAATETKTARLTIEAELVRRTLALVRPIADRYVLGQRLDSSHEEDLKAVTAAGTRISKAEIAQTRPGTKSERGPDVGSAAELCRDVCSNAIPRLFAEPNLALAAFLHDQVLAQGRALIGVGYWRLVDFDGDALVEELTDIVSDLHAVLSARLSNPQPSSRMRRASRSRADALGKTAQVAREEGARLLESQMQAAQQKLIRDGHSVRLLAAPAVRPSGLCWPPDAVALVVDTESLFAFLQNVEHFVDAVDHGFGDLREVTVIPRRAGTLVAHLAVQGRRVQGQVVPAGHDPRRWGQLSGDEVLEPVLCAEFERLTNGIVIARAVERLGRQRKLVAVEEAAHEIATGDVDAAAAALQKSVGSDGSGFLREILEPVQDLLNGRDADLRLSSALRGDDPEVLGLVASVRVALTEWDIDPAAAASLTGAFLSAIG